MSWLARSLANSLLLDDDDENDLHATPDDAVPPSTPNDAVPSHSTTLSRSSDSDRDESNQARGGVKEDLSELRDSLTRQLWGVASFLAPPPPPPPPPPLVRRSDGLKKVSDAGVSGDEELDARESGQLGEFEEQSEDYYSSVVEDAVGVTEEVLAFARNIAHHPETWLDFPLSEEEEFDEFDISDAQHKHALAVEYLAPRLAALRIELCPVHMSDGYFWMVYFVLLHSRLNKHDADLLSSPQLVQARAMWIQELQKQTKEEESYWSGVSTFHSKQSSDSPREDLIRHSYEDGHFENMSDHNTPTFRSAMHKITDEHEIEKHTLNKIEFIDKSVIKEDREPKIQDKEMVVGSSTKIPDVDDDDDWLKEDADLAGYPHTSSMVDEEDISFSDLEDDLDCTMPIKYNIETSKTL